MRCFCVCMYVCMYVCVYVCVFFSRGGATVHTHRKIKPARVPAKSDDKELSDPAPEEAASVKEEETFESSDASATKATKDESEKTEIKKDVTDEQVEQEGVSDVTHTEKKMKMKMKNLWLKRRLRWGRRKKLSRMRVIKWQWYKLSL